jgi:hypothetical protein
VSAHSLGQPRVSGTYSERHPTAPDPAVHFADRPGDRYILLDGGLVQNTPNLPVIDLDFLKDSGAGHVRDDVEALARQCAEFGLRYDAERIAKWINNQREVLGGDVFDELDLPATIVRTDHEDGEICIVVEGGVVQNMPALQILDLDFLHAGGNDVDEKEDAEKLTYLCDDFGRDAESERIHRWVAANFS